MALIRHRAILPGPVLVGFAQLFDRSYGDPLTPLPYVKVRPAIIGGVLLPFPCPACEAVRPDAVHPKRRFDYCDEERGFSWCPACKQRYVLDEKGSPLAEALPPGATHAPAVIERKGKTTVIGGQASGLKLLGATS